jgi:hypothetical protein
MIIRLPERTRDEKEFPAFCMSKPMKADPVFGETEDWRGRRTAPHRSVRAAG